MSTHTTGPRPAPGVERVCDLLESHDSAVAMVLLWFVPALALVVALLYS